MRTIKIIKDFVFTHDNRSRITLGTDVRLDPDTNSIQLKPSTNGRYPITSDLYVKTWIATPRSAKQWLLFESVITHSFAEDGSQITGDGYRLGDGVDEYFWDGANWVINSTSWNTENEVCTNIGSFPLTTQAIQVTVNLYTTDEYHTPTLSSVKILYASAIEFQEDIYRSLVLKLKDEIKPIADYPVKLTTETNTIDLINDYPLRTPYNVLDVDSAFDNGTDPNHLIDVLYSYNPTTKVITLNSIFPVETVIFIRFFYVPEVSITTRRVYTEIDKVPCINITSIKTPIRKHGNTTDSVINKNTGVGIKVFPPVMIDIEFVLRCLTDKALDQHRLTDEIRRIIRQYPFVTSRGLDEDYPIWLIDDFDQQDPIGDAEIEVGILRFQLSNALLYNCGDETAYAVKRFIVDGPPNVIVS